MERPLHCHNAGGVFYLPLRENKDLDLGDRSEIRNRVFRRAQKNKKPRPALLRTPARWCVVISRYILSLYKSPHRSKKIGK